ncbi:MAG: TolC family protein [Mariprofundaceae bacterium]
MQWRATARQLALQALTAFYRLASDALQARLARESVRRAERVLAWQKRRERFGLGETADRLQAEALLAARRADLARAEAARDADRAALNRLMLRDAAEPLRIDPEADPLPRDFRPISPEELNRALARRPEIRAVERQLAAAREQRKIAEDGTRMQLDLVLQAGTRALDTQAAPAFARGLAPKDRFVGLSVEMSDDFGGGRARAALEKALQAEAKLEALHDRARAQLETDLANAETAIRSGLPVLRAARARARAERAKFEAEMARYRDGRSNIATLVQAEEALSAARVQAEMQALALRLAARQRQWALAELLDGLGVRLADEEASP